MTTSRPSASAELFPQMKSATPILRIFDEARAREFYGDYLGFQLEWEHRFGQHYPLYMQVSRGGCILHLSGHHGDACPGAAVRIDTPGLDEFCDELRGKPYRYAYPNRPEESAWGTREFTVTDPFGNRLTFFENLPSSF